MSRENNFKSVSRLRELLQERRMSQYKLAKLSGITESTINSIFSRNSNIRIATLEKICSALGITLAQFFSESREDFYTTQEERCFLTEYRTLDEAEQEFVRNYVHTKNQK